MSGRGLGCSFIVRPEVGEECGSASGYVVNWYGGSGRLRRLPLPRCMTHLALTVEFLARNQYPHYFGSVVPVADLSDAEWAWIEAVYEAKSRVVATEVDRRPEETRV